jgi:hypothetical protein
VLGDALGVADLGEPPPGPLDALQVPGFEQILRDAVHVGHGRSLVMRRDTTTAPRTERSRSAHGPRA